MATTDVYRALWRHRLIIIVLTVVTGAVAFLYTTQMPKVYEATALVRVQQKITTASDAFGSLELGTRLAQTYATIVTTRTIDGRVAAALKGVVPASEVSLSAKPVLDVELLQVSARSTSPIHAALVANQATVALQQFVKDTGTLRDQIIVVDKASVPTAPVSPRTKLIVAIAILLGLVLNSALALVADLFADRMPEAGEIEGVFGRPLLAVIPSLSLPKRQTVEIPFASQRGGLVQAPAVVERERSGGRGV
jgi:polysaccharide biosynthesis transport protein